MKIKNSDVTLADDARPAVNEEERSGFLDWLSRFVLSDEIMQGERFET